MHLFFSLFRQREEPRETMLHASMQKESQLFELGCGTRYAQTVLAPSTMPFSVVAFLCCISRYRNQFSLGIRI